MHDLLEEALPILGGQSLDCGSSGFERRSVEDIREDSEAVIVSCRCISYGQEGTNGIVDRV